MQAWTPRFGIAARHRQRELQWRLIGQVAVDLTFVARVQLLVRPEENRELGGFLVIDFLGSKRQGSGKDHKTEAGDAWGAVHGGSCYRLARGPARVSVGWLPFVEA